MAAPKPTEAEIQGIWADVVDLLEETKQYGTDNAKNVVGMQDVVNQAVEGQFSAQIAAGVAAIRRGISNTISRSAIRGGIDPVILTYGGVLGIEGTDPLEVLREIIQNFKDNSKTVLTRAFSYAAFVPGGSNIGSGAILRCTVDEKNNSIEDQVSAETLTAKCINDRNTGAVKNEEIFEVRGIETPLDGFDVNGTGVRPITLTGMSSRQTRAVRNPSFSATTSASPTLLVTNWTISSGQANLDVSATVYRTSQGDTNSRSLNATGNFKIIQAPEDHNFNYIPGVPYVGQLAVQRQTSCDGIMNLRIGSKSVLVDLTTLTNGQWARLIFQQDSDAYPVNFTENGLDIEIELSGQTTGNVLIDDFIHQPFVRRGPSGAGTWMAYVGADTLALLDDTFSAADTFTDAGKIQKYLSRGYDLFFPHAVSSPTFAEPT